MNTEMEDKYIIDAVKYLNKYCEYYTKRYDDIKRISVLYMYTGKIIVNIEKAGYKIEIKVQIPDKINEIEGDGAKADYIILAIDQILNRLIFKQLKTR